MTIPIIDLNLIEHEDQLIPIIDKVLNYSNCFLLQNYANQETIEDDVLKLTRQNPPSIRNSDALTSNTKNHQFFQTQNPDNTYVIENWVFNNNTSDPCLFLKDHPHLYDLFCKLNKLAQYFYKLCSNKVLTSASAYQCGKDNRTSNLITNTSIQSIQLQRYFENLSQKSDHAYQIDYNYLWSFFTLIPQAVDIQCENIMNGRWVSINKPDCIFVHINTSYFKIDSINNNTTPFKYRVKSHVIKLSLSSELILQNDTNHYNSKYLNYLYKIAPYYVASAYPLFYTATQFADQKQQLSIFLKKLDSMLLFEKFSSTSKSSLLINFNVSILPKFTKNDKEATKYVIYLKQLLYLWNEVYNNQVYINDDTGDILIDINGVANLSNPKFRLAIFNEKFECFINHQQSSQQHQSDKCLPHHTLEIVTIPEFVINKRFRNYSNSGNDDSNRPMKRKKNGFSTGASAYLCNSITSMNFKMMKHNANNKGIFDSDNSLTSDTLVSNIKRKELEKIARLDYELNRRLENEKKLLLTKCKQILHILISLKPQQPYTITYLISLVIDSLGYSRINEDEIRAVLDELVSKNIIKEIIINGNPSSNNKQILKVYRWHKLDKQLIDKKLVL
ncbi:uncharacterized protein SCODWIG_01329 [Saccharomycodes ludwigii]|uniref:Uncharacterized protein n=1 Tax=Saccharomycodes ludwigii TaxID=36035 RepID=A0A376B4F0_9ASCO|nr:uncharacterized protein SCODWIG_01329 [Saccharomycodes ludwigii]